MTLLVAVALAASIAATAVVMSVLADREAAESLRHEADSFRKFVASPTGREQHSVEALLTRYLEDSVPDSGETFFTLINGEPAERSAATPPVRLDTDQKFIAHISGVTSSVTGWWSSPKGKIRYGVLPVTMEGDPHRGSLVIVQFRDIQAAPLLGAWKVFAIVAVLALGLAALASWLVAGQVLAPVRLVRKTAEQITETDLHKRIPVTGNDDVARLAATFNHMLDRLESAFSTQRQFLDDAGHELRTPITVIRGHLELLGDDPAERSETIALVLDELDRMRRIVEELLDLARAERPDFVRRVPTNITDLTVDALANARVLGDRLWGVDEVAEGTVLVDAQRLTQALMQLVSNAVSHTDDGAEIAVGSRISGDQLLLWVRDNGPGIDPADRTRIFQRFHRGNRQVQAGGVGIGLAIKKPPPAAPKMMPGRMGATYRSRSPREAGLCLCSKCRLIPQPHCPGSRRFRDPDPDR
ncbi:MAG TPA: HAMP domain-containing sensor histidine kinase [Marmoricola sp.]|nr:HAMP domain-containing sensor histidine kinase [Marmoricola sp.]